MQYTLRRIHRTWMDKNVHVATTAQAGTSLHSRGETSDERWGSATLSENELVRTDGWETKLKFANQQRRWVCVGC